MWSCPKTDVNLVNNIVIKCPKRKFFSVLNSFMTYALHNFLIFCFSKQFLTVYHPFLVFVLPSIHTGLTVSLYYSCLQNFLWVLNSIGLLSLCVSEILINLFLLVSVIFCVVGFFLKTYSLFTFYPWFSAFSVSRLRLWADCPIVTAI